MSNGCTCLAWSGCCADKVSARGAYCVCALMQQTDSAEDYVHEDMQVVH